MENKNTDHPPMNKQLSPMEEMLNELQSIRDAKHEKGVSAIEIMLLIEKATELRVRETELLTSSSKVVTTEEDGWIRVEDGLPDDSMGRVLCWCKEVNDLGKSYFFWNCSYSKLHGFTDNLQSYHVTHWKQVSPPKN